jgi:hypothetical protein
MLPGCGSRTSCGGSSPPTPRRCPSPRPVPYLPSFAPPVYVCGCAYFVVIISVRFGFLRFGGLGVLGYLCRVLLLCVSRKGTGAVWEGGRGGGGGRRMRWRGLAKKVTRPV